MTDALYLVDFDAAPVPGTEIAVEGDEAHHAVAVKRLAVGEGVLLGNGRGLGVRVARKHLSWYLEPLQGGAAPTG